MGPASGALHRQFGTPQGNGLVAVYFSARFDETGTDGHHDHAILAGGVSPIEGWDHLEVRWDRLMRARDVGVFHARDFNAGDGDFAGWKRLKRSRFINAIDKIIGETVQFDVAIAVNREFHASVKKQMQGVRGFRSDSDVGFCFRMALFLACQQIRKSHPDGRLEVIVEDGPFSSNMAKIHQSIKQTAGAKYKPAMFADMLEGFASVPKGTLRSLEASDFLADRAIDDLRRGRLTKPGRPHRISAIAGPKFLDWWRENMLEEREHRTQHGRRSKSPPLPDLSEEE